MLMEEQDKKRTKMWVGNADLYVRRRCGPLYLSDGGDTGKEVHNLHVWPKNNRSLCGVRCSLVRGRVKQRQ